MIGIVSSIRVYSTGTHTKRERERECQVHVRVGQRVCEFTYFFICFLLNRSEFCELHCVSNDARRYSSLSLSLCLEVCQIIMGQQRM